jgi:hypothetical protein
MIYIDWSVSGKFIFSLQFKFVTEVAAGLFLQRLVSFLQLLYGQKMNEVRQWSTNRKPMYANGTFDILLVEWSKNSKK